MSSFKNAEAGIIVDKLIKTIQEQRDYLSEIDGKIGDGDHGINMNKGFTIIPASAFLKLAIVLYLTTYVFYSIASLIAFASATGSSA